MRKTTIPTLVAIAFFITSTMIVFGLKSNPITTEKEFYKAGLVNEANPILSTSESATLPQEDQNQVLDAVQEDEGNANLEVKPESDANEKVATAPEPKEESNHTDAVNLGDSGSISQDKPTTKDNQDINENEDEDSYNEDDEDWYDEDWYDEDWYDEDDDEDDEDEDDEDDDEDDEDEDDEDDEDDDNEDDED